MKKKKITMLISSVMAVMVMMTGISSVYADVVEVFEVIEVVTPELSTAYTIEISGLESSYSYTGSEITPEPTVYLVDEMGVMLELDIDTDYTLTYSDNINVGTATITITLSNDIYSQTNLVSEIITETFEITADSTAAGVCGDNLSWILSSTGSLTITGTGDMWDYKPRS